MFLKNCYMTSLVLPFQALCIVLIVTGFLAGSVSFAVGNSAEIPDSVDQVLSAAGVTARIAQGEPVSESAQFEWMASLRNEFGDLFCGAVVVDSIHLLTAAHCVAQFAPNRFQVHVGGKSHQVERVWLSHEFGWSHLDRDIAVVQLKNPLAVESIPLATSLDQLRLQDGDELTVLGYGQSFTDGPLTEQLAQGQVPFVSPQTCASSWRSSFPSLASMILEQSICASGVGSLVDTCTGDSGGPLLLNQSGRWQLLGLTSFGEPRCGGAQKPSVYSSVSAQFDLIQKALSGEAYYGNWTQVLVDDDVEARTTFQVTNNSQEPWRFDSIDSVEAPFQPILNSTCLNRVLLPQQSCTLTVIFQPHQGGFYSSRMLLRRQQMSPIWIDLQGFAFDFVPESQFGEQGVFGFTGGELLAGFTESDGVSSGGYLYWNALPPLETTETYIGTESSQELTLFFEFKPESSNDQLPIIDIRKLSAFGQEIPIELDKTLGWQRQNIFLAEEDFLYIRIQAPGRGMTGILKFDVLAESDTLSDTLNDFLNEVDIEAPIANQAATNPRQVMLESGGSLSLLGLLLMMVLLGRSRSLLLPAGAT